jgi:hypothetical protein
LSRDEAKAKVRETIAVVDRWYDSDDWKPWSPPTPEEEVRNRASPSAMRSEIAMNEEKYLLEYRQLIQIPTTAQHRASADSGREVLDPTPIEKAAVAIVDCHNRLTPVDDCSNEVTVTTAVDNDNAVRWKHLSAQPLTTSGLSILQQVKRPRVSAIKDPGEWTEIEITVDSGACVTVMPRSLCEGISILQNRLSREGVEYEVANGAHIPNLGERRCEMMTVGSSVCKSIVFQVADVHKPLLSISGCADMGFDCYLGDKGGHLLDKQTGERIPLGRRDNLYIMRAWIRQDPGINVSQPFVGPS